jgi:hypothetical protein
VGIEQVVMPFERFQDRWQAYKGEPQQDEGIRLLYDAIVKGDPGLMSETQPWATTFSRPKAPAPRPGNVSEWATRVKALNLSQPDASTCQSACIAMAVGDPDIRGIRARLVALGDAGAPVNMGRVLRAYLGGKYVFNGAASLDDAIGYLKAGEFLITHGWFTRSGHVICLDGTKLIDGGKFSFNVKDPWSEFDGPTWSYNRPSIKFFDGFYSDRIIYAACVAGASRNDAAARYNAKPDYAHKAMWVHRILP